MSIRRPPRQEIPRQDGAILVITMILMLVLSLLGVSSMQSSNLLAKIATNTQIKHRSFHNSEAAVRAGESHWDSQLTACLSDPSNCNIERTPPVISDLSALDWNSAGTSVDDYGRYVVEYLGERSISGDNERQHKLYRISARGTEESGLSKTVIQTIYRYCVKILDGLPCPIE